MCVYKYVLLLQAEPQTHRMPVGARVLHVHEQSGKVCVWCLVDTEAKMDLRTFRIVGTGWDVPPDAGPYCGTAHVGGLVWHVFG